MLQAVDRRHTRSSIVEMVARLRFRLVHMIDNDLADFALRLRGGEVLASHKEATRLFRQAKRLYKEVVSEMDIAESDLACCSVHYAFDDGVGTRGGVWTGVLGGVLFGGMVGFASCWLRAVIDGGGDTSHKSL
jgi:hypothetical protein